MPPPRALWGSKWGPQDVSTGRCRAWKASGNRTPEHTLRIKELSEGAGAAAAHVEKEALPVHAGLHSVRAGLQECVSVFSALFPLICLLCPVPALPPPVAVHPGLTPSPEGSTGH